MAWRILAMAGTAAVLAVFSRSALAQPQVPSYFFGSASVDGKPPPDGTEVRGFVDGIDCTQLGPGYRGTVTVDGVGAYVIAVVHEAQKPGCGKPGKTVTFTVGGRPAPQTGTWNIGGPQQLDLNAGSGEPLPFPSPTPTRPPDTAEAAATATTEAQFTPRPAGTLPTDSVELVRTPSSRSPVPLQDKPVPPDEPGGFPVLGGLLIALAIIAATGTAAGVALSRRGGKPGEVAGEPPAGGSNGPGALP